MESPGPQPQMETFSNLIVEVSVDFYGCLKVFLVVWYEIAKEKHVK